jgi:hypothetical protein
MAARRRADEQARRTKVASEAESTMNSRASCRESIWVRCVLVVPEDSGGGGSGTSDGRVRHNLGMATGRDVGTPASFRDAPRLHVTVAACRHSHSAGGFYAFNAIATCACRPDATAMAMPLLARLRLPLLRTRHVARCAFSTSPLILEKSLPPRRVLLDSDLIENFLHGSGPGGQKINKTSSAVQLKHIPTGIVVKYQDTRSRTINRKMARKILQEKIEELELGEGARTKVKQREKSKKKQSADKKKRRKYRKLAGEEGEEGDEIEGSERQDGIEDQAAGEEKAETELARKPEGG